MIKKLLILLSICLPVYAGPGVPLPTASNPYFDQGMAFGQGQLNAVGSASALSSQGNAAIQNLNQGTNLVQPNGATITNLQSNGVSGSSSGTGLGSFGTGNVNSCASYVIGTGGPARDAECSAVGFASQTTNLNVQANTAYPVSGNSQFLQNAKNAMTNANISTLLPSVTLSGSSTCTTQPVPPTSTTQSCYVYNGQTTSGGAVSTWASGTALSETCTGTANLSTSACTINPAYPNQSTTCLSPVSNTSSGTPQSYPNGSNANVTCTGGAVLVNNTCTVTNNLQTTLNSTCFSQNQAGPSSSTSIDFNVGSYASMNCIAPANLALSSCQWTTPLDAATTNQTCQISVPVQKTCNILYSVQAVPIVVPFCTSGSYPIYDAGCAWGQSGSAYMSNPIIGWANVACSADNRSATISLSTAPIGIFSSSGSGTVYNQGGAAVSVILYKFGRFRGYFSVSWNGNGYFYFGYNGPWYCASAQFSFPMGMQNSVSAVNTTSDSCAPYGG